MKEIEKYATSGFSLQKLSDGRFEVFTTQTQHFYIKSLEELTPETFEHAIQMQKDHEARAWELWQASRLP